jgi:hypothetical protein
MSSELYGWMLINNFIANYNKYRKRMFVPGNHFEANKMVIRWYGIGGAYVDPGLLMYLPLERKPDN